IVSRSLQTDPPCQPGASRCCQQGQKFSALHYSERETAALHTTIYSKNVDLEPRRRTVKLKKDQAATEAEGNGFGAGRGAELAQDGGHVEFGGMLGDFQVRCDLLVAQAAGQHLQDFFFAWSEGLQQFGGLAIPGLAGG